MNDETLSLNSAPDPDPDPAQCAALTLEITYMAEAMFPVTIAECDLAGSAAPDAYLMVAHLGRLRQLNSCANALMCGSVVTAADFARVRREVFGD